MTGRQRTFELIPTTLARPNASKPPMTSKAAKKAYQQAQRGPKISKAEQRKRDAAEYERIRKEHEKERNVAKAKAAREKKAVKAEAEKDARRKAGLPEPSRFVRASQPTISRFIKNDSSTKRSWKQMEGVAEETDDTTSDAGVEVKDEAQPPAKRIAKDHDSEDEFGDFPSFSQFALEEIDSSVIAASAPPSPVKKLDCQVELHSARTSPKLPPRKPNDEEFPFDDNDIADMVESQLMSEAAEVTSESDGLEPPEISLLPPILELSKKMTDKLPETRFNTSRYEGQSRNLRKEQAVKNVSNLDSRPSLQERSMNMPPPRLPLSKPHISFATLPARPELVHLEYKTFSSEPPSATQAFLEDHLDDFFPSPSQQVRELLEDADDIPLDTQIARELSPEEPMQKKPIGKKLIDANGYFDSFVCTQDLILSPQDLEEITTPSRGPPTSTKVFRAKVSKPPPAPARLARPASRDRPRFFEEKEDDLLQAALHESKTTIRTRGLAKQHSKAAPLLRNEALAGNGQREAQALRFFEEKEEDILQAALHESKKLAAKQAKPKLKAVPKKGRPTLTHEASANTDYGEFNFDEFFEDEEEKQLQAVIEESKKAAGLETQKVPLNEAPEKQKRTLKRIASAATDYGDDDFSGCSQELLALL